MRNWVSYGAVLVAVSIFGITVESVAQVSPDTFGSRRRATGAPVAPVYEGWEKNPDGTSTMYFGYQNRNWEEEIDIPIGPNNFFSPGSQDRGQPTHFSPNRQKKVFSIVVPGNFGAQVLTWTLTSHGSTESVPGKLSPLLRIDSVSQNDASVAPKVNLGPDQTITLPQAATLTAQIASGRDPGTVPASARARAGAARAGRLTVRWRMLRGPGTVTFAAVNPPVTNGQAVTTAKFSKPGVYVLQALGDEGSMNDASGIPGFICCWTNAQITVVVKEASSTSRP